MRHMSHALPHSFSARAKFVAMSRLTKRQRTGKSSIVDVAVNKSTRCTGFAERLIEVCRGQPLTLWC